MKKSFQLCASVEFGFVLSVYVKWGYIDIYIYTHMCMYYVICIWMQFTFIYTYIFIYSVFVFICIHKYAAELLKPARVVN